MTKVLIVDDDLELQDFTKFIFENAKYEVFQSYDGVDALKKVREINPDVIILDVMMPEMNGFEVMEELRSKPETCLIPVIMLTSLSQTKDKLTGLKLGADEYLVKSIDPHELLARVENLLKRYHYDIGSLLTRLPGINRFEADIKLKLDANTNFALIYLNINNFKPYNLRFGYDSGDNILKLLCGILRSTVTNLGNAEDTIYNLCADHFVIVTTQDKSEEIGTKIINLFNDILKKSYDDETISKGEVVYKTRDGKEIKSHLMSLSVGIANVVPERHTHYAELIDYVKDLVNLAKQQCLESGSSTLVVG